MSVARNERRLAKKRRLKLINEDIQTHLADRACGECTACCTVMAVREIDKVEGAACSHLCASGCGVYDTRPTSCRKFNCIWRYGLGGAGDRPDKSGIVFDVTGEGGLGGHMLIAREARPGAFQDNGALLSKLVHERHVIVLIDGEHRRVIGPPDKLARVAQAIREASAR